MRKRWRHSDIETLRTLLRRGRSCAEISKVVNRSPKSVASKASRLGLLKQEEQPVIVPDAYPEEYYEGVLAISESDCPYGLGEMGKRCWWMAGLADGQKGAA